jgi:hypothetical protein
MRNTRGIKIGLALLLIIPAIINIYTPLYNFQNPTLVGLPFFWWFEIVLLGLTTIPYLVFSYIDGKRNAEISVVTPAGKE